MPEETGAELLARIKPKRRERGTHICLRPDLLDAWADAENALTKQIAEDAANKRLAGGKSSAKQKKLAEAVEAIEAEIEDTQVRFVFQSMPKDEWRELCDAHPPRKGNQFDLITGYDVAAVNDAAVRKCMVSPVFEDCTKDGCVHEDCGSWQQFIGVCNPSEWDELRTTTTEVNGVVMDAPKSSLAARVLSRGGRGRAQPAAGG